MNNVVPTHTDGSRPPTHGRERERPLPTRFGREKRRLQPQPEPATRAKATDAETRSVADDELAFEDDGGL